MRRGWRTGHVIHRLWVPGVALFVLTVGLCAGVWAQGSEGLDLEKLLGPGATLQVAPNVGTFRTVTDSENQFSEAIFETGVVVRSPKFNLDADKLVYNGKTNRLYAYGKPVRLKQDQADATCRKFTYEVDAGKLILEGKPVIQQKTRDANGKVTKGPKISGGRITLIQKKDGSTELIVDSGGLIEAGGKAPKKSASPSVPRKRASEPAKLEIDVNDVGRGSKKPEPAAPEKPGPVADRPEEAGQDSRTGSGRGWPVT